MFRISFLIPHYHSHNSHLIKDIRKANKYTYSSEVMISYQTFIMVNISLRNHIDDNWYLGATEWENLICKAHAMFRLVRH